MSTAALGGARDPAGASASWLGLAASIAIYSLFATVVFLFHGSEPPLSADHLAYMRLADEIMRLHPDGSYWKRITQIHSYGVALAYLYALTGSHVLSFKLLLALLTVLSLLAFELFIGLVSDSKWKSVLFSLVSGSFVTFGASFWGYTDFAASLQRTVMVPVMLTSVWFFLSRPDRAVKFAVFPFLVAASILHLGAYYVAAVLGLLELWDWAVRRRFRLDRRLMWFGVSLAVAYLVRIAMEVSGLAFTGNLWGLVFPDSGLFMDPAEAWQVELKAFPWRNMPLPLATVATIAASYGLVFVVAVTGIVVARRQGLDQLDRAMLLLAGAILVLAYGPQTLLWIARQFLPVYPFSVEETRAINLIMIPSLYFGYRVFDSLWAQADLGVRHRRPSALLVVFLLVLQPLELLRILPTRAREGVLETAVSAGFIRQDDSLRLLYARQLLGLDHGGERFYYSARGVVDWLRKNAGRDTRVVSTLNELLLTDVQRIGPFNGLLGIRIADPERKRWADSVVEVERAMSSHDIRQVEAVAKKYGAELAIVPWPAPNALYRDEHYSVIRTGS
jgi:hypothetical protein